MSSDWLRVALLLSEISRSIGSFSKQAILRHKCLFIIMSLKRKRSVLSTKDKQAIILRLEKEEKGTNLSAEYGISKWQISDILKSKEKIMTPTPVQVFTTVSEGGDHIVLQTICKCFVSRLNGAFLM